MPLEMPVLDSVFSSLLNVETLPRRGRQYFGIALGKTTLQLVNFSVCIPTQTKSSWITVINECQTRLDTENLQLWREAGLLLDGKGRVLPSNTAADGLPDRRVMKEDIISNTLAWLSSRLRNFIAAGEGFNPVPAGDFSEVPQEDELGDLGRSQKSQLQKWNFLWRMLMCGLKAFPPRLSQVRGSSRRSNDLSRMPNSLRLGNATTTHLMKCGTACRCVQLLCSIIIWHEFYYSSINLMRSPLGEAPLHIAEIVPRHRKANCTLLLCNLVRCRCSILTSRINDPHPERCASMVHKKSSR